MLVVAKAGLRRGAAPPPGALIVFDQPPALRQLLGSSVKPSDQFVKRVAAAAGEMPSFESRAAADAPAACFKPSPALADAIEAARIERGARPVGEHAVFVRGDCDGVSVDSRVFGDVDERYIVGRPLYRVWPPGRRGPV